MLFIVSDGSMGRIVLCLRRPIQIIPNKRTAHVKKVQVALQKPWVTKWIGIDSSEKIHKLGAYDMYGGFQLSGKAVFNLATNYENENVQPRILN